MSRSYTERAPGIDPLVGMLISGIAALLMIISAIVYAVVWLSMFIWMGFKNGFAKTAQHIWEANEPKPTNRTI